MNLYRQQGNNHNKKASQWLDLISSGVVDIDLNTD